MKEKRLGRYTPKEVYKIIEDLNKSGIFGFAYNDATIIDKRRIKKFHKMMKKGFIVEDDTDLYFVLNEMSKPLLIQLLVNMSNKE